MTYLWDFYGPDAQGTAEHFAHHVDEFIVRNQMGECPTGVESVGPGHVVAWCTAPEEHHSLVFKALKPKRGRRET